MFKKGNKLEICVKQSPKERKGYVNKQDANIRIAEGFRYSDRASFSSLLFPLHTRVQRSANYSLRVNLAYSLFL